MNESRNVQQLGELLRSARIAKNLSARQLATLVELNRSTITMLERAQIEQPRQQNLQRLAKVLELDAADLLTLAGYQAPERLPSFGVYLRATTGLPPAAIEELNGHLAYLRDRYEVDVDGPKQGADE